jgi:hypothetical protein
VAERLSQKQVAWYAKQAILLGFTRPTSKYCNFSHSTSYSVERKEILLNRTGRWSVDSTEIIALLAAPGFKMAC